MYHIYSEKHICNVVKTIMRLPCLLKPQLESVEFAIFPY